MGKKPQCDGTQFRKLADFRHVLDIFLKKIVQIDFEPLAPGVWRVGLDFRVAAAKSRVDYVPSRQVTVKGIKIPREGSAKEIRRTAVELPKGQRTKPHSSKATGERVLDGLCKPKVRASREEVLTFVKNYQAKFGATPNMFSAQAYDAAMIMAAAIEKAEASGAKAGSNEYKAAVIAAMKATDMDCVTGHVTYDQYNNPEKSAAIIKIEGGAAKYWGNY